MKDKWFLFDAVLVIMMVAEVWFMNAVILIAGGSSTGSNPGTGNASVLRLARIARVLRVSRMVRLLRAMPELVVVLKGIKAAARSVSVFFVLWLCIIYVFGVVFKLLTEDDPVGNKLFKTVPAAMNTLLLDGILPDSGPLVNDLSGQNPWLFPLIMFFIMLASVTVMYMLIGVLVDVVTAIAAAEKEGMTVAALAQQLRDMMNDAQMNSETPVTAYEFKNMMERAEFQHILLDFNVDAIVLLEMSDMIFEDPEVKGVGLTFPKLLNVILSLRGNNPATVKDIKESQKIITQALGHEIEDMLRSFSDEFTSLREELESVRTEMELLGDDFEGQNNRNIIQQSRTLP